MESEVGFERGRRRRGLAVILSMIAFVFFASDAHGQEIDADRALARTRMAEGRARRHANDLRGALESFRAADSLLHFPTTGLEVARAEADVGLLLQARETLRRVLDTPEPANDLLQFQRARAQAAGLAPEIEQRIPTLRITVRGAPSALAFALSVDGVAIAPAVAAEPQRLNPGRHVVVATGVAGEAREEVDLEAHDAKEIRISLPAQTEPPSPAAAPAGSGAAKTNIPPRDPIGSTQAPPRKTDRRLALIGVGVACAGATVSAIAGVSSISYVKSAENSCSGGRCPPSTHDDLQTAHTLATLSNVFVVVAAVGVGAGIVGLLQKPKAASAPTSARLAPWLGLGAAGINGTF